MTASSQATPMPGSGAEPQLVTSAQQVRELQPEWELLSQSSPSPNAFATCGWFRAWTEAAVHEEGSARPAPWVIVWRSAAQVERIAPFVIRASSGPLSIRKLGFATHHSDYNDLLLGAAESGHADLFSFLNRQRSTWEIADLRDVRGTESEIAGIAGAIREAGLFHTVLPEAEGCPYFKVTGNAAAVMSRLSGHVRRTLRRRRERALEEGLRIRMIWRPDQEPGLLDCLSDLDHKKSAHREAPLFIAAHPEQFQSLFHSLGPSGAIYVALAEIAGQPAAFQLGFRCGNRLWDYTKAYDRSLSRFAPGSLILPDLVDFCALNGIEEYDFLRGEEEYKMIWSDGCHRRHRLIVWNKRLVSRACAAAYLRYRVAREGAARTTDAIETPNSPLVE